MKTSAYALAVTLGLAVAIVTQQVTAADGGNSDAMGTVAKLQAKISALESRVAALEIAGTPESNRTLQAKISELEQKVLRLEADMKLTDSLVDYSVKTQSAPPLQIRSQDQILEVFRRGMFVPAK